MKPKLLCIDDQAINIQLLYQIFAPDHEMVMTTHGAQAVALCEAEMPDLILLDVVMPDMDGHEVCRQLKQHPALAQIPVIFITAQHNIDEETAGLAEGAVDFISRPFNAAVVRARAQTHIQLYQLKTRLEQQVRARNEALELAQQRLHHSQEQLTQSEARATISTLIASISHELSSPIGNSRMASSSLQDFVHEFRRQFETGKLKRSGVAEFLDELQSIAILMQRNLASASELLSNLRQVSADQASEQRRRFDLADTIGEIIHTIGPSLKRKPHRIEVVIAPGIEMDSQPGSLGQVVINLINNAYLHAFDQRNDGLLRISSHVAGQQVLLCVEDNGSGMPEPHLEIIFEPFFSTKIGRGGTGLGMAIVHNLVTKTLQGTISVSSTPGIGTRFEICLPLTLAYQKTL